MDILFIKQLIKKHNASTKELAAALFPDNKFPENAFRRVLRGKTALTADQAKIIADHLGVTVDELYSCSGWRGKTSGKRHTFTKGDYTAELNLETGETRVYHKETKICDTLYHCPTVTLSEFLSAVDNIIKNYSDEN